MAWAAGATVAAGEFITLLGGAATGFDTRHTP
jgi:hypothetical protein